MLPTYAPGDFLLVWEGGRPVPGAVVVVLRNKVLMVKRVWSMSPDGGEMMVLGDNRAASTDSRTLGPVAVGEVVGRVVCRYWRGRF